MFNRKYIDSIRVHFSIAMLVYRSVTFSELHEPKPPSKFKETPKGGLREREKPKIFFGAQDTACHVEQGDVETSIHQVDANHHQAIDSPKGCQNH